MTLIVDSREPEAQIKRLEKLDIKYQLRELPVGDYLYEDKGIIFERKTVSDFINSFRSGRIKKQLKQMEQFPHPYLLIIGEWKNLFFQIKHITIEQLLGMLASVQVRYKVRVVQVPNEQQAIKIMQKIYDKTDDGKEVLLEHTDLMKTQVKTEDIYLKMLSCIPGLSLKKAGAVLKKFKFKDLFSVTDKQLQEIDGIGNKLSRIMKTYFN